MIKRHFGAEKKKRKKNSIRLSRVSREATAIAFEALQKVLITMRKQPHKIKI